MGQMPPSPDNDVEMSCHRCTLGALAAILAWLGAIPWHFPGSSRAASLGVFGSFFPP